MAEFSIIGKVSGDKDVIRGLNRVLNYYLGGLRTWLKNERAGFLGGPDAKGRHKRGFRDILSAKKLARGRESEYGSGKSLRTSRDWSWRMAGLFSGHIPFVRKIDDMSLKMGVIAKKKHKLHRALELMQTGGTITSAKQMPIPHYRNLAAIGYRGPWHEGSAKGKMKSAAFENIVNKRGLVAVKKGGKTFYFDKQGEKTKAGTRFLKRSLLFIGVHGITVKKVFKGRYDFYGRWNKRIPGMIRRGQVAVDRTTKIVNRRVFKKRSA